MGKARDYLVWGALALAVFTAAWFPAAAVLTKTGLIDWRVGFGLMTIKLGPQLTIFSVILGLLAFLGALGIPPRRLVGTGAVALIIPAAILALQHAVMTSARSVPPIHDISTDLDNPPQFDPSVVEARAKIGGNDLDLANEKVSEKGGARYGGRRAIDIQREAYPDIKTRTYDMPASDLFEIALDAAKAQSGWTITRADPRNGTIEAVTRSFWFGFTDDVAIRLKDTDDESGTILDVRSASRVGGSDLGANAKRVRAYTADLDKRVSQSATGG